MQIVLSAIVSLYLGLASLALPHTIAPKHQKPHDHVSNDLYISDAKSLPGTQYGYCGAWAVSVAKRYLGEETGEPTMSEWNETANDLGVDPLSGGVSVQDLIRYYETRHFDITFVELKKNKCDAQYYAAEQLDKQCVVMLLMVPKANVGIGGHVETVLGVDQCDLHTNSWGYDGDVSMKGRFTHSNMVIYNDLDMEAVLMISCR